eukprot:3228936-Pyramimonas_sp.AAC.1
MVHFTVSSVNALVLRMVYSAGRRSVDHNKDCCCCHSVNGMSPGWGCETDMVNELSKELQARKVKSRVLTNPTALTYSRD